MTGLLTHVLFIAAAASGGNVDDAVTTQRLERMLEAGDEHMIVETFRRHPNQILPFVDGYLEGGLKMIEEGQGVESARESFRIGVEFAELAQRATGDKIFVQYAASFASWSPTEQKNFREGQRLYKVGRQHEKNGEHEAAETAYKKSLHLAETLNDYWGQAMALAGRTRVNEAMGDHEDAVSFGRRAVSLNRRLNLQSSEIDLLLLLGKLEVQDNPRGSGLGHLRRAWELVKTREPGDDTRQRVLREYRAALRAADIDRLRDRLQADLEEYGGESDRGNGSNGGS